MTADLIIGGLAALLRAGVDVLGAWQKGVTADQLTDATRTEITRLKLSITQLDGLEQAELDAAVPRDQ